MSLYAMDVMISRANVPVRVACLREIQVYLAFIHYFYIRPLSYFYTLYRAVLFLFHTHISSPQNGALRPVIRQFCPQYHSRVLSQISPVIPIWLIWQLIYVEIDISVKSHI